MIDQASGSDAAHHYATGILDEPPAPAAAALDAPRRVPRKDSLLGRPRHLLELACKAVRASRAGVAFLSAEGELVEHLTFGLSDRDAAELWRSAWVPDLVSWIGRQASPTYRGDLTKDHPELAPPRSTPPVGALLAVSLATYGRGRGALYLVRAPGEPAFAADEEETAQLIGTWLEPGSLYEEARLLARVQLLNQVVQEAAGNPNLSPILKVAVRELDRHLPMHVCAVWLAEEQPVAAIQLAEVSSLPGGASDRLGLVSGMRLPLERTSFKACLQTAQALYADLGRPGERDSSLNEDLAAQGATCFFAVPLRAGDRIVGILQSVCTRPTGFTREQIQMLYLVGDLLGPAISNCQLFGKLRSAYEELQIAQRQLVQAEKMRALGELASGMAHEFNNALCGTLGFIELALLNSALDASCRAHLESARTCALDAAQTVRRVQDFARQRRNDLQAQPLDLNDLVRQTVELTRPKWENLSRARRTPLAVEVRAEANARVAGSPAELREVLTNLIFNAVDAMPDGGRLAIRVWSTDSDVFFSVQDTGAGIPDSVRQRLFEPFFTTKGERGNGLGLSVAFGIVSRHGGSFTVDSEVGRGTTFTVRLPVLAEARADTPAASATPATPDAVPQGLRVLVVEDEESIRRFLAACLTRLGHRPRLAADAHEGLAAFREERFDVVLTDLGLPGISGKEVARVVHETAPAVPVILLTGWADQIRADKEPVAGVTQVLGKPITVETLGAALAAVISKQ